MLSTATPKMLGTVWGSGAGGTYIRTVPDASQIGITAGAASWTDGFPPLTFADRLSGGGRAPSGRDFNGVLNEVSQILQYMQAGAGPRYDSSFATAIGGYPNGGVLQGDNLTSRFRSTVDNNTTNPNSGGSNWIDDSLFGLNIVAVDNISALRGVSKLVYSRAIAYGYTAKGDQGGGDFWLDTSDTSSSDNGINIIEAADGGRWKLTTQNLITLAQCGADCTGTTASDAAVANSFAVLGYAVIPAGGIIRVTAQVLMPVKGLFLGFGVGQGQLLVAANVAAVMLNGECTFTGFTVAIASGVTHTVNLIEIGSTSVNAGRSRVHNIDVSSAGQDNISWLHGNLGHISDIRSLSAGRRNLCLTNNTVDDNDVTLEGFIDLQSAGENNYHIEGGSNLSDATASRTHNAKMTCQGAAQYNIYIGSRSNLIEAYCESAGVADVFLDTYSHGSRVEMSEGTLVINNCADPDAVVIMNGNLNAGYRRGYASKLLLSGVANKGLQIGDDDGTAGILEFRKLGTAAWGIVGLGTGQNQTLQLLNQQTGGPFYLNLQTAIVYPLFDNTSAIGQPSLRYSVIYSATGTINTSDAREKQDDRPLNEKELAVARRLQKLMKIYRWKTAVAEKGDGARFHIGWYAQEVKAAFETEGLDAFKYACCCYDTWDAHVIHHEAKTRYTPATELLDAKGDPTLDKKGNKIKVAATLVEVEPARDETIPAGDRYSVREGQIQNFIIAALTL